MRIDPEVKLDFDDVLIRPKRSTAPSRSAIELERPFFSQRNVYGFCDNRGVDGGFYNVFPLIAANMSTIATMKMTMAMFNENALTCLHKHYSVDELYDFFYNEDNEYNLACNNVFYTMGIKDEDLEKLKLFISKTDRTRMMENVCIDAANGYTKYFVDRVAQVRDLCPDVMLMAGNVATPDMVQELVISAGVDVVKIGIGPGCFVKGTKVLTKSGYKEIQDVEIGEEVLTHRGRWRKVVGVKTRREEKKVVNVNGLESTASHEYYVLNKKYIGIINDSNIDEYAEWIEAQNLTKDYLLIKNKQDHIYKLGLELGSEYDKQDKKRWESNQR